MINFSFHTDMVEADFPEDNMEFDRPDPDWVKELRGYQRELAEPGLQEHNYIICAPTGSGKTMVAAYVVYDHLRRTRYRTCFAEQLHIKLLGFPWSQGWGGVVFLSFTLFRIIRYSFIDCCTVAYSMSLCF